MQNGVFFINDVIIAKWPCVNQKSNLDVFAGLTLKKKKEKTI